MVNEYYENDIRVDSEIGIKEIDSNGSPVCGARIDASKAYKEIPDLLEKVINKEDTDAWEEIVKKIDYIYTNIDHALMSLDRETKFIQEVKSRIDSGKKLFFKPNLVGPQVIDTDTHSEDLGAPICTDWSIIAALMRWFHDKLDINYHQMALGEASTTSFVLQSMYSEKSGKNITSEAIFEGRSGDFYGGWGFYFVRCYLGHHHPSSHTDDPMRGYYDSISGNYYSPGDASDRLMLYDLNKLANDPSRGRTVPVPDGDNYKEITMHKVIIGGDPKNAKDMKEYPGCVLVNVPKLKIHAQDLITNAIKNLGIGLYPTQCPTSNCNGHNSWKYSLPSTEIPSYKAKLPHMPWVVKMDDTTNLPLRGNSGKYETTKTAGMPGTQADVIKAVQDQDVFILHVSDSINMINLNHNAEGIAVRIPEGYIWSSLDCVALDLFCSRYCFKTVPMSEGMKLKEKNNWITEFVHHVPIAKIEGKNIVTVEGLDSPLFRYNLYNYVEKRGIGQQQYYVTGWDSVNSTRMVSIEGHLGIIADNKFVELITNTMYYNPTCLLWDMQRTVLSYAEANDKLIGSSIVENFKDGFDENNDGIIDYNENGKKGFWTTGFSILSHALNIQINEEYGLQKGFFYQLANFNLKNTNKNWNSMGHDFAKEYMLIWIATNALEMSNSESINEDPLVTGMKYGKGKWPSWLHARYSLLAGNIYGSLSYEEVSMVSLYGTAFSYADKTLNNGLYTGSIEQEIFDSKDIKEYFEAVSKGADLLDFTLYVPLGFGSLDKKDVPNVTQTNDPNKIFTAHFDNGKEVWK